MAKKAAHAEAAQAVMRFLSERGQAELPPARTESDPSAEALLADLLGATLIDAQDELRLAWAALAREADTARHSEREGWLVEPPPWPPASVESLRAASESGPWLETLAAELAPEPEARAWLLASWQADAKPIDGAVLAEIAHAASGKVLREPRFRAWLCAEWTAWARQRYFRAGPWAEVVAEAEARVP